MRRYDIFRLDVSGLKYVKSYANRSVVEKYMTKESYVGVFYVVYSYVDPSNENGKWKFMNSTIFLDGIPVVKVKQKIEADEVMKITECLGRVYYTDGRIQYLHNKDLTCNEMFEYIGGWGHIKVIKDEPERWALVYRDVDYILLKKSEEPLPEYNPYASTKFHMQLFGNVIYINENYL